MLQNEIIIIDAIQKTKALDLVDQINRTSIGSLTGEKETLTNSNPICIIIYLWPSFFNENCKY